MVTLHLAKQNFKFSAAHFLIFDANNAERLHGHNYQVKVDIVAPSESEHHADGYFVDFNVFKKHIKNQLDSWDEMILLPKNHPEMIFKSVENNLTVHFRDRFYSFPKNEVQLLPITNTSVENLSSLLAEEFMKAFKVYKVKKVRVYVEETRGQGASTVVG